MNETTELIIGFLIGGVLGLVYFTGLWWTVRRLTVTTHVWRLYFGSLLVRLAVVLGSFYVLLQCCRWPAWVACFVAFLIVRLLVVRVLGRKSLSLQDVS